MSGMCSNSLEQPNLIFAWTGNERSPRGVGVKKETSRVLRALIVSRIQLR